MRCLVISLTLLVGGCSIVLDPGSLRGGGGFDADTDPDARVAEDAGPDARTADDAGDAGETDPDGGGCVAGEMMCGGGCVDTRTSNAHCGACDNACDDGQSCLDSTCRPSFIDARRYGGADIDSIRGVATDAAGNAYLAIEATGDVDFGGGMLAGSGETDIAIVSLGPDASFRWAMRFGGVGADSVRGIDVASDAGVVLAGEFSDTVDFGTGPLTSAGGTDIVVAALDPASGATRWSRRFGGAGRERVLRAHVSPTGVLYVAGNYESTFDFAGAPLVTGGDVDGVLLSLDVDAAGATDRWAYSLAGTGRDTLESVSTDGSGNFVCTVGQFSDVVVVGGSPVTSAGGTDAIITCLDASGGFRWSRSEGGSGPDQYGGVAFGSDFITATGAFSGEVTVGTTPMTANGIYDGFSAAYALDGTRRWSVQIASPGDFDFGLQTATGPDDRIYVVGLFQGAVTVSGQTLPHAGLFDAFLGVFRADGALDWARSFGGSMNEGLLDAEVATDGTLWLTGEMQSDTDFGGGVLRSAGDYDGVVVRYLP